MKRIKGKQLFKILFGILFIFILCVFFALIMHKKFFNDDNKVKYDLDINSQESLNRTLKYKIPVSDKIVLNTEFSDETDFVNYVDFEIDNSNDKDVDFDIYVEKNKSNDEISESYVKFALFDGDNNYVDYYGKNNIPVFDELDVINDLPSGHIVFRGNIKSHSKKKYILVSWVSDKYSLQNINGSFSYTIGVKSR